jgi:hypothetical protein
MEGDVPSRAGGRDISVTAVKRISLDDRGSIPGRGRKCLSSPPRPDRPPIHLVPKLRLYGAIPLLTHMFSWRCA